MAKLNVEVIVGLVDRLTRPLAGMQRNLQRTAASFSMAGMGASMAGQQILGPLQDAARASMELESAMADVRKVVDFPAPDGLAQMQTQIEELSKTIPLAASELAQIAAAGGQLGIAAPDLSGYVETVAKAATAFDMIPAAAGEAFAKLSNVFAIPIADVGSVGDAINHLSNNSAAKASEIVDALSRIGGTAKSFGLSAQQASALAASMLAMGETSETAGTSINFMLARLQTADKQAKKFQGGLASIGLTAADMQRAVGEDAASAVQLLMDKLAALPEAARMGALVDLFGIEHAPKIAKLAGNTEALSRALGMVGEQSQYAGSMQAEFAARSDTTANKLQLIGNQAAELQRRIGDALLPAIVELSKQVAPVVERVSAWIKANPELAGQIVLVAGAIGALLVVFGTLAMGIGGVMITLSAGISVITGLGSVVAVLGTVFGGLAGVLGFVGRAFTVLRIAIAMNPIGALLTVVAGAIWVFTHWEETIAAATDAWEWLIGKLGFDPVQAVAAKWQAMIGFFTGLWDDLTSGFDEGFIQGTTNLLQTANPITVMIGLFQTLAPQAYAAIATVATGILAKLREILSFDTLREIGANLMRGLVEGIKSMASGAWDAVKGAAKGVVDAAKAATGVQSPSWIFADIGRNLMLGLRNGIDRLAAGPMQAVRGVAQALLAVPLALAPIAAPAMQALDQAFAGAQIQAVAPATHALDQVTGGGRQATPDADRRAQLIERRKALGEQIAQMKQRLASAEASRAQQPALQQAAARSARPNMSASLSPTINISSETTKGMDERGLADLIQQRMQDQLGDMTRTLTGFFDDPDEV